MKDIYGLSISHQSSLNHAQTGSVAVKPFVDYYPYQISNQVCGDGTYIRVISGVVSSLRLCLSRVILTVETKSTLQAIPSLVFHRTFYNIQFI